MTWSDMVSVNRSTDDEPDANALNVANDMDRWPWPPTAKPWPPASSLTWTCPAPAPTTSRWGQACPA
jgi:hypothetical protein